MRAGIRAESHAAADAMVAADLDLGLARDLARDLVPTGRAEARRLVRQTIRARLSDN